MSDTMSFDTECLFCKILRGEVPSEKVYADSFAYAFRDINPQAPTHILVIPRAHIQSVAEIRRDSADLIGHLFTAVSKVARNEGLEKTGYRVVSNVGEDAGQTVPHLHFHILGGTKMDDKMV